LCLCPACKARPKAVHGHVASKLAQKLLHAAWIDGAAPLRLSRDR
jgi:hypothetical protein